MKIIKLSIIIPVYNIASWIKECVNSIKPYLENKEIEVIIVNDGSTDDSEKIIKKEIEGTGIKLFTKKNGGLPDARNFGVKYANGEYLWFVDGDDMIIGENIDKLLDSTKKNIDIIHFKIDKINDQTHEITKDKGWVNKNNKSEIEDLNFIKKNGLEFSPWSKIYKAKLFKKYEWPPILYEDVFLISELLMNNKISKYYLDESFYRYRINREGSILNNANDNIKNRKHIKKIFEYFKDKKKTNPHFIAGMYLLTSKIYDLNKEEMKFYKKNLRFVLKQEQFKNYFKRSISYKAAKICLNLRMFPLLKLVLKNRKISQ